MRRALWMTRSGAQPPASLCDHLATQGWVLVSVGWGEWPAQVPALALVDDPTQEVEALRDAPVWVTVLHGLPSAPVVAAHLQRGRAAIALAEAFHRDALSGLLGRAAMPGRMSAWLEGGLDAGTPALMMLDLDHFKRLNDRHGHGAGDLVIQAMGRLLTDELAPSDLAFRLGGEEFAVLMSRADETSLRQATESLLDAVRAMRVPGHDDIRVTTSAGMAWLRVGERHEAAMDRAAAALYRAKAAGRDRLVVDAQVVAGRVDPEAELRRFMDTTQVYSERLTQMVHTLSRRLMQGARREALEDRLTGVANRRYFDERLQRECGPGRALALMFLDLDDFGAINRRHGWSFGDVVLQRFAQLAAAGIRLTDWLARWGGEEFCIVMPGTALDEAAEVAERLRLAIASAALEAPDGQPVRLTCSIGVAARDLAYPDDPDALVARAASAARRAKNAGKNRVEVDGR